MEKKWWKEAVVYQIYPRSFMDSNGDGIGDLAGITSKLEYLQDLGIDVIWLSPIYQSPNADNGYDISDYQAISEQFGTMKEFDAMLAKAHSLGIRIVMDLVVNHTSDEHRWFVESRSSKDSPYRDFYIWKNPAKDGGVPNNWGSCFGGSAWEYDEDSQMYYLHCFHKKQPDLNWENPSVREHVFEMMRWWCDKGIDGFRMDVINMISKDPAYPDGTPNEEGYGALEDHVMNGPNVHTYLKEMNQKVLSQYDVMSVGETPAVTTEDARKYAGFESGELNMVFEFEHVNLDDGPVGKWTDKRVRLADFRRVMNHWQTELSGKAWNSLFLGNHDQPRCVSRFGNDTLEYRDRSAKMLAVCLHFMQGTPYVYQGDELGMANPYFMDLADYRDVESLNAFRDLTSKGLVSEEDMMRYLSLRSRDNARTPMQWDASANAGFTTGTPWIRVNPDYVTYNAQAEQKDPTSVFHFFKKLIHLRKQHLGMVYGTFVPLLEDDEAIYAYERVYEGKTIRVLCNFTDQTVPCDLKMTSSEKILIHNCENNERTLLPYEAIAFYCE